MTSWQSSLLRALLSQASKAVPSIEPRQTSKILELGQSIGRRRNLSINLLVMLNSLSISSVRRGTRAK